MNSVTTHDLKMLGWAIQRALNNKMLFASDGVLPKPGEDPKYDEYMKNVAGAKYALKKLRFENKLERKMLKKEDELRQLEQVEEPA